MTMRRSVTLVLAGSAGLAALASLVALHVGRGTPAAPWEEATGWNRIAPALRPGEPRSRIVLSPREPGGAGESVELRWLGHSGFLLGWHGRRLLLDPDTSDRCSIAPRRLEPSAGPAELAERCGPVDAVLLSHAHYDHMDLPTLRSLARTRSGVGTLVVPAGSEGYVSGVGSGEPGSVGRPRIVGLQEDASLDFGPITVTAVAARHNGGRHHPLASRHLAVGYVIRAGDTALYYAGDTGYGPHLAAIGAAHHPRLAILPIGSFSPAWPIGRYHLSPEEAVVAARDLGVDRVVPCHFGTFVLALDGPSTALPRFARAAHRAGIDWVMPELLTPAVSRRSRAVPRRRGGVDRGG
jgi:L-ascorbate metabolism protein UlaG (beta-lactamase superfamily)